MVKSMPKKLLSVFLCLTVLAGSVILFPVTAGAEADYGLVENGGFETGDFTGWHVYGDAGTAISTDVKAVGEYSCLLKGVGKEDYLNQVLSTVFPITRGSTYTITFKAKGAANEVGGMQVIGCNTTNIDDLGAGNPLTENWPDYTTDWKDFSYSFTVPGDFPRKYARLKFIRVNCNVYIDELHIDKQVLDDGYVVNGDFETGDDTGFDFYGGHSGVSAEAEMDGSYGAYLTGNSWNDKIVTKAFAVDPDTDYTLNYDLKCLGSGGFMGVYIQGSQSADTGFNVLKEDWPSTAEGAWEHKSVGFNSGAQTYIFIEFNEACGGDKYLDNIRIEKAAFTFDGYITNGDFETGKGTGWVLEGETLVAEEAARSGRFGCFLKGTGWNDKATTRGFLVEPNANYQLTYSLMGLTDQQSCGLYIKGGNAADSTNTVLMEDWPKTNQNTWEDKTISFNTGDYTYISIEFNHAGGGNKYLDNVALSRLTEIGTVVNGGFELGNLQGWELKGNSEVREEAKKDGSCGLYLSGGSYEGIRQLIPVEKKTVYRLSYDFKDLVGSANSVIYVKGNSLDGPILSQQWFCGQKDVWVQDSLMISTEDFDCIYFELDRLDGEKHIDNIVLTEISSQVDIGQEVFNGDLETGDLTGWSVTGLNDVTSEKSHSGDYSLLLNGPGQWTAIKQTVQVEPNSHYLLSFWANVEVKGGSLYKVIGKEEPTVSSDFYFYEVTGGWKCFTVPFESGQNTAVVIDFEFCDNPVYIDDVAVQRYAKTYDAEMLINGGFEAGWLQGYGLTGGGRVTDAESHSGTYSLLMDGHINRGSVFKEVAVEENTNYLFSLYTKAPLPGSVKVRVTDSLDTLVLTSQTVAASADWKKEDLVFNTGENSKIFIHLAHGSGDVYVDDLEFGLFDITGKPVVTSMYAVSEDRVLLPDNSLVADGGFEKPSAGAFGESFLDDEVKVEEDRTNAYEGSHALHIRLSAASSRTHSFRIPVEKDTAYIIGLQVKGAVRSEENRGTASFGIAAPDTGDFLVDLTDRMSSKAYQMSAPAWDGEWHELALVFRTGQYEEVAFAVKGSSTELWIDNLAVVKLTDARFEEKQKMALVNDNPAKITVGSGANLLKDTEAFWTEGTGYGRHVHMADEDGATLKITSTCGKAAGAHYYKTVSVAPHTTYVFAMAFMAADDGAKVGVLDEFGKDIGVYLADTRGEWYENAFSFDSGDSETLTLYITDAELPALLGDMRLFKEEHAGETDTEGTVAPDGDQPPLPGTGAADRLWLVLPALGAGVIAAAICCKQRKKENAHEHA